MKIKRTGQTWTANTTWAALVEMDHGRMHQLGPVPVPPLRLQVGWLSLTQTLTHTAQLFINWFWVGPIKS